MPEETLQPQDKIVLFTDNYLGGSNLEKTILLHKNPEIKARLQDELETFSGDERTHLVKSLIIGISKDDALWNVDKRDGAVEILKIVDFKETDVEDIWSSYKEQISNRFGTVNPYGWVFSLLEA